MPVHQSRLEVLTRGRGTQEITSEVQRAVQASGIATGLCHLFLQHTSAALLIAENADPAVRRDLETFMQRVSPDGASWFTHTDEGPDDMAAHLRTLLTGAGLSVPVTDGRCALGIWQGIYLWEHRHAPHRRTVIVTVQGDAAQS
jgi:secondary thiamine-phosphate synthase enzyme